MSFDVEKVVVNCQFFSSNFVMVCLIKMKIDMFYQMNNNFRNTVSQISLDVPLSRCMFALMGYYHVYCLIKFLSQKSSTKVFIWSYLIFGLKQPGITGFLYVEECKSKKAVKASRELLIISLRGL